MARKNLVERGRLDVWLKMMQAVEYRLKSEGAEKIVGESGVYSFVAKGSVVQIDICCAEHFMAWCLANPNGVRELLPEAVELTAEEVLLNG